MNDDCCVRRGFFLLSLMVAFTACSRDKPSPVAAPSAETSITPSAPAAAGLKYIERMLGGAQLNDEVPLVIAIHGLGDRPESFGKFFDGVPIRTRLILPYGPLTEGDGFSWFRVNGFKAEALAAGSTSAAAELSKLIADLKQSRRVRGKPIVTGFSQGGMLSFALSVLHPEDIGEALPVAGLLARPLYPTSWPMTRVTPKITAFHGAADTLVPFADGSDSVRYLTSLGFTATLTEYPNVKHFVSADMRRDWLKALDEAVARATTNP